MKPPLFDEVLRLSYDIVNAIELENTKDKWDTYQELKGLCELNKNTKKDHPIQWEALGDFTINDEQALNIYAQALSCSESLGLDEYSASIYLATAERCYDLDNTEKAIELLLKANRLAEPTDNLELRSEISGFILELNEIQ